MVHWKIMSGALVSQTTFFMMALQKCAAKNRSMHCINSRLMTNNLNHIINNKISLKEEEEVCKTALTGFDMRQELTSDTGHDLTHESSFPNCGCDPNKQASA